MLDWTPYILPTFRYTDFAPGAHVLDVGCGNGTQLAVLEKAGYHAVGVEPDPTLVEDLRRRRFAVLLGTAERLPVDDRAFDGLVCKVVVPYTDERRAVAEWARVLRPGARAVSVYHGAGYYLRCVVEGSGWRERLYGLRALVNTWCYALSGRRLPGFVGDTLYQSRARLDRYYRECGFTLERESPAPRYMGLPVFIYHEMARHRHGATPAVANSTVSMSHPGSAPPSPMPLPGLVTASR